MFLAHNYLFDKKEIADLGIKIIFPETEVQFLKPTYQICIKANELWDSTCPRVVVLPCCLDTVTARKLKMHM